MTRRSVHVDTCLNCGAPTPGAFCAACGQEAVAADVRFRAQLRDLFGELFSFEAKLPRTLKVLLVRPGELTRAYNAGQRVRYVTPIKTLLFLVFVYLAVYSFTRPLPDPKSFSKLLEPFLAPRMRPHLPPVLVRHLESVQNNPAVFMGRAQDLSSNLKFLLVPVHALLLKLAYLRTKKAYGAHVVFSLHAHAFNYLLFLAALLVGALLKGAARFGVPPSLPARFEQTYPLVTSVWITVYLIFAAKRVYGDRTWPAFWKTLWIGCVYLAIAALASFGMVVVALLFS